MIGLQGGTILTVAHLDRKSYMIYRILQFSDREWPKFQRHAIIRRRISQKRYKT